MWPEDTWWSCARESLKVPRVLETAWAQGCEHADEISESRDIGAESRILRGILTKLAKRPLGPVSFRSWAPLSLIGLTLSVLWLKNPIGKVFTIGSFVRGWVRSAILPKSLWIKCTGTSIVWFLLAFRYTSVWRNTRYSHVTYITRNFLLVILKRYLAYINISKNVIDRDILMVVFFKDMHLHEGLHLFFMP